MILLPRNLPNIYSDFCYLYWSCSHGDFEIYARLPLYLQVRSLKRGCLWWVAPPCSTWIFLARGSTGRTYTRARGVHLICSQGVFLCFHKVCMLCTTQTGSLLCPIVAMQVRRDTGVWGVPIVLFDVWSTCYLKAMSHLVKHACVCEKNVSQMSAKSQGANICTKKEFITASKTLCQLFCGHTVLWRHVACMSKKSKPMTREPTSFAAHVTRPCWRGTTAKGSAFHWAPMVHRARCLSALRSQSTNDMMGSAVLLMYLFRLFLKIFLYLPYVVAFSFSFCHLWPWHIVKALNVALDKSLHTKT